LNYRPKAKKGRPATKKTRPAKTSNKKYHLTIRTIRENFFKFF